MSFVTTCSPECHGKRKKFSKIEISCRSTLQKMGGQFLLNEGIQVNALFPINSSALHFARIQNGIQELNVGKRRDKY